ncbi:MAG: hypothetical protein ACHP65_09695 [Legionellales bacterium]
MRSIGVLMLVLLLSGCYATRSGNVMEWDSSLETANISYLDIPEQISGYAVNDAIIDRDNNNAMAAVMQMEQQQYDATKKTQLNAGF